jgi:hypothetical protein
LQSGGLFRHHAVNAKTGKASAEIFKSRNGGCQSSSRGFAD